MARVQTNRLLTQMDLEIYVAKNNATF